jgi:hypothetical protein
MYFFRYMRVCKTRFLQKLYQFYIHRGGGGQRIISISVLNDRAENLFNCGKACLTVVLLHTERLQHTNAKTFSFFKMLFYGKPENFSRLRKIRVFIFKSFARMNLCFKLIGESMRKIWRRFSDPWWKNVTSLGVFTWNVPITNSLQKTNTKLLEFRPPSWISETYKKLFFYKICSTKKKAQSKKQNPKMFKNH